MQIYVRACECYLSSREAPEVCSDSEKGISDVWKYIEF